MADAGGRRVDAKDPDHDLRAEVCAYTAVRGVNMGLAERIANGRRVDGGALVVPLGTAVPGAPPCLADVRIEVRAVGDTLLSVASVADPAPRSPAFWKALGEEIHAFLGTVRCAAELALVGHVLRGLPAHPARERIERRVLDILEPPAPTAALASVTSTSSPEAHLLAS